MCARQAIGTLYWSTKKQCQPRKDVTGSNLPVRPSMKSASAVTDSSAKIRGMDDLICFAHASDEYREFFTSREPNRPTFFWFTDRYYDHISHWDNYSSWKYFYLFIKDPEADKIEF